MLALLVGQESCPYVEVLRNLLHSPWDLLCIPNLEGASPTQIDAFRTANALISVRFDDSFPETPSLQLLQAPSTGINSIRLDRVPPGVVVCNSYGHEIAVAEYGILGMLLCAHDLMRIQAGFRAGKWFWSDEPVPRMHAEVFGKTVCVIGLGRIGRETARRARALGMHVVGCNRTPRAIPEVHEVFSLDDVASCAARADFVFVTCALTDETRGIVGLDMLQAMKPSAFIINVSRGDLIDEAALYNALQSGRIAGAVLDVWYRYPTRDEPHPRPSKYPFHELQNVVMTPHVSGWTDGMVQRRWSDIAHNLDAVAAGQPPSNVIPR